MTSTDRTAETARPSPGGVADEAYADRYARARAMHRARLVLLVLGAWLILGNVGQLYQLPEEVKVRVLEAKLPADEAARFGEAVARFGRWVYGAKIAVGAFFVANGLGLLRLAPVYLSMACLVAFGGLTLSLGFIDPSSLPPGIVFKVLVVVGLLKVIHEAGIAERGPKPVAAETSSETVA